MEEFKTEQRGDFELIQKAQLKRAKRIAIVFGVLTGLLLIALVKIYVQYEIVEQQAKQIDSLKTELKKKTQ